MTCTILTGKPNELLSNIHDRMPIIIPDTDWKAWLDTDNTDREAIRSLMGTYPSDLMAEYPVSTLVNKVANNTPDLLTRLETPAIDL